MRRAPTASLTVLAAAIALVAGVATPAVSEDGVLELTTRKRSLETIGRVPPRRDREVEVGTMRFGEPDLPPEEMTLQERLILRAKKAAAGVRELKAKAAVERRVEAKKPDAEEAPATGAANAGSSLVPAGGPDPQAPLSRDSYANTGVPSFAEGETPTREHAFRGGLPRPGVALRTDDEQERDPPEPVADGHLDRPDANQPPRG